MNSPKLHGDLDLLKAKYHLTSIEIMFEVISCSKEDMVVCATHMLRGYASRWWTSASNRMSNLGIANTWEHFKAFALDKYFTYNMIAQEELEFQ